MTTCPSEPMTASRRVDVDRRGRFYELPDGERYPSVTNILSVIGKPALVNWAANQERDMVIRAAAAFYEDLPAAAPKMSRMAYTTTLQKRLGHEKAHQKALAKACEIGTQTHALIEWNLRRELGQVVGPQPEIGERAAWAFAAYQRWRERVSLKPLMIEQTIWSRVHEYAGTLDWIADVDLRSLVPDEPEIPEGARALVLGDWKTGKAIYEEALLQNAAYVEAFTEMGHGERGTLWGVIVRLPKAETDPDLEVRVISPYEQVENLSVFLSARNTWAWIQKHNRWMQGGLEATA